MEITLEYLRKAFDREGYICGDDILIPVYLALRLGKPLLVTGAPGVGKTEIAKVLSRVLDTQLIRLQCYEGLDENKALYEWNYQRQLLKIQMVKDKVAETEMEKSLFSEEYLLERPLLKAILAEKQVVLLIDEIDKTDEEFEAFLFEVLSDFQVSIPEMGTIVARHIPVVVLTSNGERELSDGLKRRCIFLYIDYPSIEKEIKIIKTKVEGIGDKLAQQIARAVNYIRKELELKKKPAISETLDWARALIALEADRLNPETIEYTLSVLFKDQHDLNLFRKVLGPHGLMEKLQVQEA
ncbi:AAA family ATPase [Calderihabitans maritimus]|uniref:ATPase n=1 Tax=Calderihabitans maritimus TaxID=1246530 RepID=A0A1Z5HU12_9FIRM|nr:MoxR family ATPase [Calderihabitans maritimus]GAW93014.1 ATPase [Calderihabitans maritimus]